MPNLRDIRRRIKSISSTSQITRQLRAGFVFLSMILWEPPPQFWDLPPYFLDNHRILIDIARDAGLGILSYEQQAENWRVAMAKVHPSEHLTG